MLGLASGEVGEMRVGLERRWKVRDARDPPVASLLLSALLSMDAPPAMVIADVATSSYIAKSCQMIFFG